jgi:DNA-binding FadR family transcriptional regulator
MAQPTKEQSPFHRMAAGDGKRALTGRYSGRCEHASVVHAQWHEAATFRRRDRKALAQLIADDIRRRIVTGDIAVDSRLPSVVKLAHFFGVSTPTAQAAVHILVALGFVSVSRGNGTYVRSLPNDSASLTHAMLHATPVELGAIRAAIDERAAILAAAAVARAGSHRPARRALSEIHFLAGEFTAHRWAYPDGYLHADLRFHAAIIRAVRGMEVVPEIYLAIGRRLEPVLLPTAGLLASDDALESWHAGLAAAVLDGSVARAGRLASAIARREAGSLEAPPG